MELMIKSLFIKNIQKYHNYFLTINKDFQIVYLCLKIICILVTQLDKLEFLKLNLKKKNLIL